jgi:GNAT superfamily N-acetyltransferase
MHNIIVSALSKRTLVESQRILSACFGYLPDPDEPARWLEWSLDKTKYGDKIREKGVVDVSYYVAVHPSVSRVVGMSGLYINQDDKEDSLWIGWTAVVPEWRRRGVGNKLLGVIKAKARETHKKYLKVYTSDYPKESIAELVYRKHGFQVFRSQPIEKTPFTTFYLQLDLDSSNS